MTDLSLGEFVEITSSKRIKRADYVPDGIPFYRSKEVIEQAKGNKISTELFISEEQFSGIEKKFGAPKPGDILLTSVGTLGVSWQVEEDTQFYFKDGNLTWFRNFDSKLDSKYLMYWLRSRVGQQELDRISIGSTQRALTIVALKSLPFSPPPVSDQKAIAHVLGTLDDKIELNQKMNQTLEEIAKAIFKSWFVDFDPVRAKAEGRSTGLPPEISDLFPDELVDSEIGEIPKGWVNCEVRSFVKLNDQSWSKKNHPDSLEYLDLGSIKSNKISEIETYLWDEAPSRARRVLEIGDTIVGTVRPGNRSFGFIQRSGITGSTGFAVLTPLKDEYAEFVYLGVCSDTNIERLAHLADGGAYPAVSNEIILDTSLVKPTPDLVMSFHKLVSPLIQRLEVAEQESTVLSELRDTLLPKLISGELRIPDAEKFLEEAGI